MKNKCIAIIPARGGSKRIPRKNIREFCGKPIIAYSIEAALCSNIFDVVMVSTDDEEIGEVARQYGAEVPFMRSKNTSDDYATVSDVAIEVLNKYKEEGMVFDYLANIYATAPFVSAENIRMAYNRILSEKGRMIMPLVRYSYPPQRSYVVNEQGFMDFVDKENINVRSQDLRPMYHEVGQYYIYRVEDYLKEQGRIYDGIIMIETDELHMQDIDTMEDWQFAEFKYKYIHGLL